MFCKEIMLVFAMFDSWLKHHRYNKLENVKLSFDKKNSSIELLSNNQKTVFYLKSKKMKGSTNNISEDLRDFLRRRGIKIHTGRPFKSILPRWMENL